MRAIIVLAALVACDPEPTDDTGTTTHNTSDTTTTTTTPTPIAATGLQITCNKDETIATLTAQVEGAPDEAIVNMSDFVNVPANDEEHPFTFDAKGVIEALDIPIDRGTTTWFNCPEHFAEDSAVMSYAVRVYSESVLADCRAGSETDDAQAYLDGEPVGASTPEDFSSCTVNLVLSY